MKKDCRLKAWIIANLCCWKPLVSLNERANGKPTCFLITEINSHTFPFHPIVSACTIAFIPIFCKENSIWWCCTTPRHPPLRINEYVHIIFHEHCSCIRFPWSSQESADTGEVTRWQNVRGLDNDARWTLWVILVLGRYCISLAVQRLSCKYETLLDDHDCASTDEIYCSVDVALAEELAIGVGVEGVLEAVDTTSVVDGSISSCEQCHGLSATGTGCVHESKVSGDKSRSLCGW